MDQSQLEQARQEGAREARAAERAKATEEKTKRLERQLRTMRKRTANASKRTSAGQNAAVWRRLERPGPVRRVRLVLRGLR